MLILGSSGFSQDDCRAKLAKLTRDRKGTMLIIGLACRSPKAAGGYELSFAVRAGFKAEDVLVFDESCPENFTCKDYDYITVIGGNTFRLLAGIRKYHLDTFIKQQLARGADYIGFSAGACIAAPDVEYIRNFDDNNDITDGDFTALALTDKFFLCHFDSRGYPEIRKCRDFIGDKAELLTINETEYLTLDASI